MRHLTHLEAAVVGLARGISEIGRAGTSDPEDPRRICRALPGVLVAGSRAVR